MSADLSDTTFEKHYSIKALSILWGLGRETVRRIIMNEPGVLKISLGKKQCMVRYTIPESVARRIHTRLFHGDIAD